MTFSDKITMMQTMIGEDEQATNDVLCVYLEAASSAILERKYPFGVPDGALLPAAMDILQVRLAVRYFLRRGAEGEISHGENGVSRSYGSVNDEDILSVVTPYCKV